MTNKIENYGLHEDLRSVGLNIVVETPATKNYTVMGSAPTDFVIDEIWGKVSTSDTADFIVRINGTAITHAGGGSPDIVATQAGATTTPTGLNVVSEGDRILVEVSALNGGGSPGDLEVTLKGYIT